MQVAQKEYRQSLNTMEQKFFKEKVKRLNLPDEQVSSVRTLLDGVAMKPGVVLAGSTREGGRGEDSFGPGEGPQ